MIIQSKLLLGCLVFLMISSAISCSEHIEEKQSGVLTKSEFTTVLIDVYLAEAKLDVLNISKDSAIKLFIPYEDKMLKKYGLADSTLRKTYQYYMAHPTELELVYDALIDTLSLREQQVKDVPPPVK